jgi:hypothetical protein
LSSKLNPAIWIYTSERPFVKTIIGNLQWQEFLFLCLILVFTIETGNYILF